MPNLIEVQRASYEQFLQMHTPAEKRDADGPRRPSSNRSSRSRISRIALVLEYVAYEFEQPKFDVHECMQRDLDLRRAAESSRCASSSSKSTEETGAKSVKDIKETGRLSWATCRS